MSRIRSNKLKKKQTVGYISTTIVNDDNEDIVNTVDVTIEVINPEEPIPSPNNMALTLKSESKRFVFNDLNFSADATGFSYKMTSVMKDINNNPVGEPLIETVTVEPSNDISVRAVTITQRKGNPELFRLKTVIVGDHSDKVASVEVVFSDFAGPEPIPTEVTLTDPVVNGGKKVFKDNTLTFDDPSAAIYEEYTVIIDLKDAEGNSLNSSEQFVVVQPIPEEDEVI
jgi:hypothetical protein